MKRTLIIIAMVLILSTSAFAWGDGDTGNIAMGDDLDTLFESLPMPARNAAKKGDIIATKAPQLFCDFSKSVSFNDYNTAFCSYCGETRKVLTNSGKILTVEELVKSNNK